MKHLSLYDLTGIQPYIFGSNLLRENLGASFLVKQAPGLHVACAHEEWDETADGFQQTRHNLEEKLNHFKAGRWPEATFDGAGVTAACTSTGEPAVAWADDRWQGAAATVRLDNADKAQNDLQKLFEPKSYTDTTGKLHRLVWTRQIDKIGRSRGEQSMIGVIHFDGNGMGQRFRKTNSLPDLCDLSKAVKQAGTQALQDALGWVRKNLPDITDPDRGGFRLHPEGDKREDNSPLCFPVRPIVYGGDDITLVCESRIALDLAAELLRAWHRHTADLPGGAAHACAGVALVLAHYPFYRAYKLAEELCKNGKRHLRDQKVGASVLDWEFISGAALTTLSQRRDKLYKASTGKQPHTRPYYVVVEPPATTSYRSWDWFRGTLVNALQEQQETHPFQRIGKYSLPRPQADRNPFAALVRPLRAGSQKKGKG